MSNWDRFGAAAGKSVSDSALGIGQVLSSDLANLVMPIPGFATRALGKRYGLPQKIQAQIDENKKLDAPLMATKAGLGGYAAGTLAQMVGPGIAARGTAALPLVLPRTILGNALQGATVGALQPVASDESRGVNTAVGGLLGGFGATVPAVVGAGYRAAKGLLAPFTESGARSAAAKVVTGFAEDPARLLTPQQSAIPSVQRTLAEATLDPGIAQLQRTVAAREGAVFDSMRRSNNAARVGEIRKFAGDENTLAAAEASRKAKTSGARDAAYQEGGAFDAAQATARQADAQQAAAEVARVQAENARLRSLGLPGSAPAPTAPEVTSGVDGLLGDIGSIVASRNGNLAVQPTLASVSSAIKQGGDSFAGLVNSRDYIDALLTGKAGDASKAAKAATRELMQIKGRLDEEIASRAPSYPDYLRSYQAESAPINRMQVGQELLRRTSAGQLDTPTGVETLLPAQFGRQVRGLDRLAQQATGFKKAQADKILTPQDMSTIGAVNDDLGRQYYAETAARGPGSDTFQKLMTQGDVLGAVQEMGIKIPYAGAFQMLGKAGKERVNRQLVSILADPQSAQSVLAKASQNDRRVIENVLRVTGGRLGVVSTAVAE